MTITVTTGRFNPLHSKHIENVLFPMLNRSSIFQDRLKNPSNLPPFILIMGSSGPDRNIKQNPFSYEQRVEMIRIGLTELILNNDELKKLFKAEELAALKEGDKTIINSIIPDSAFLYYEDSKEKNSPPKLDRLAKHLLDHCKEHGVPTEELESYVCIKPGELGQKYQIAENYYENMHQMTAVAQSQGFQYAQEFAQGENLVSATQIRENLANNFTMLTPKLFNYVQEQLALAFLNAREVGENSLTDNFIDPYDFILDNHRENKILTLNKDGKVEAKEVPQELRKTFQMEYTKKPRSPKSPQGENFKTKGNELQSWQSA